jgi:hypothetical protein
MTTRAISIGVLSLLSVACTDTSRWSSTAGESWCGEVTAASFVRAGVPEKMRLRLELDAERLQSAPGRIWSTSFDGGEHLDGAILRPIPQLLHDPLSTFSFGEGRVKNALLVATPTGGAQVMVVLSLLQSGDVEVRLLRGASRGTAPPDAGPEPPQVFAVFRLARESGDCGVGGAP